MTAFHGIEPIDADELLYRRIPASTGWWDTGTGVLSPQAFSPHKINDVTGLSLARARYESIEEAARGQPGKSYFVGVLRADDLRASGVRVVPCPLPDDPGHAELPDLNAGNRKADKTLELQRVLTELTLRVEGPFMRSDT